MTPIFPKSILDVQYLSISDVRYAIPDSARARTRARARARARAKARARSGISDI